MQHTANSTDGNNQMFDLIIRFIRDIYNEHEKPIPLHAPIFCGKEKEYLADCIDSTFVSSVGKFVDRFEAMVEEYTGARRAIAIVNGTSALHLALVLAGVCRDEEVITQAVSFVATVNAISYCGAVPLFLDSDRETLGLSPDALNTFLADNCVQRNDGSAWNMITGRRIAACMPMHSLGHPVRMAEIMEACRKWNIPLVEDAAESVGSTYRGKHTGTLGKLGILSFNGNKTITTGGGGMILTDDDDLGKLAKHLSTTAKIPHPWEFVHDHVGYNYRLPNINAALGCAQMESLPLLIDKKRALAEEYRKFFYNVGIMFFDEPEDCRSNFWLNAILLNDRAERNAFLDYSNKNGVMTRPLWTLLPGLEMYRHCPTDGLKNARWLEDRLVCIPSSVKGA